jgi:chitodextrinase
MPVWSAPPANASSATPDTRPPSALTGLRLLVNNETTISLAWDTGQDNVAVKLYVVKGDGFTTVQTTDTKATLAWPHRTVNVSVQVSAIDTSGNQGEWRSLLVTAPLTATAAAGTTAAPTTAPATTTDPVVTTSAPASSDSATNASTPASASSSASTDATAVQSAAVQNPGTSGATTDPTSTQTI